MMMKNSVVVELDHGSCRAWLLLMMSIAIAVMADVRVLAAEDLSSDAEGAQAVAKKIQVTKFGSISVTGGEQQVRGSIASVANELREQLNELCGDPGRKMKLPLIVKLYGAEGDEELQRSILSKISSFQEQYQLLLNIHLAKGVDQYLLRYHLMELLLYERGLADGQIIEDGDRVTVKPWLIIGMLEAIDIRSGDSNREIYQADIDFLSVLPLEKVFDATENQWREMIGREPVAFRAISGAIVNSLLRQPDGKSGMSSYLAEFATFKGEYENLLRRHFSGMNKSSNSLGKWVNLELLELATARVTQVHSMLETESRLDGLLKLRYRDVDGSALSVGIDNYDQVLKLEQSERIEAVAAARAELERLSYRCFPTYRPIFNEYDIILRDIMKGENKDISSRLAKLIDVRMRMKAAAIRSRDYLDWYYITQSRELSGNFTKYRAFIEALKKEELRVSPDDATSNYLDQVQKIYGASR
jgi:hypothetical protein